MVYVGVSQVEVGATEETMAGGHDVNAVMSAMTQNINKATRSLNDWLKLDRFLRVAISVGAVQLTHSLKPDSVDP